MNIIKQLEIRLDIEKKCPSLTKEERRYFGDSMIENYDLMKQLSKL